MGLRVVVFGLLLFPKLKNHKGGWGDYRPISLVGCLYKIVAKSLARRLQRVLHGVVVGRQSSFLGGRNLLHNALIANEVVEEARRKKKKCLIFKVDYEKTYDSVS